MLNVLGDRDIIIGRELTKKFEEMRREKISQAVEHFAKNRPRGEFVVILPKNINKTTDSEEFPEK